MPNQIEDIGYRQKIIEEIKGTENEARKVESLRQVEIYNDRIYQHVWERLRRNFSQNTLSEMPVIASINLARRIAKQEASIYKTAPKRTWTNLTDQQIEVVERIYKDMGIDSKMLKSNESFKLQNQNHLMVIPKKGKLVMRVLRNHHLDAIPDAGDPEGASTYVLTSFDKDTYIENRRRESGNNSGGKIDQRVDQDSDRINQNIGDPEDYQEQGATFLWWSNEFNFLTNEKGEIVGATEESDIENPAGLDPIIDISIEKDFEYWVRQGESLTEFTIEYNVFWSNVMQIVMMQGYSQAYLKCPTDFMPSDLIVGPNHILKLPIDPNNPVDIDFGYATPSPDLSGTNESGDALLANFLTSRGLDPSLVSGKGQSQKFASGTERLLSMIESFEASKSDYDIYKRAESDVWKRVKAWHNSLKGTDLLDDKYITAELPEDSEIEIEFAGPEMIQSEAEKLDNITKKLELGLMSVNEAIQDTRGVDKKAADLIEKEIEESDFDRTNERGLPGVNEEDTEQLD